MSASQERSRGKLPHLPPFLEVFRAVQLPSVVTETVFIRSATGRVSGYLARRDTSERLPALLIIHDADGLTDWMKQNARELAGIGYVVLAVDLKKKGQWINGSMGDERTLADLSAAVRWLRRRSDVFPDRLGVAGWGWGGRQAFALAASTPLQACVICEGRVSAEPSLIAGLRGTPLLGIVAGDDPSVQQTLPAFRQALRDARIPHAIHVYEGVRPGFMRPASPRVYARDAAEQAWYEIYEFFGKYVEDADLNTPVLAQASQLSTDQKRVAAIVDIMRAVNAPSGVRGALMQSLEKEPNPLQEWNLVRARAALIVEAGILLMTLQPRKGTRVSWRQQAKAYTDAAAAIVEAADRRDYAAVQRGLQRLATTCGACHEQHR